jgi:hypothetical protein
MYLIHHYRIIKIPSSSSTPSSVLKAPKRRDAPWAFYEDPGREHCERRVTQVAAMS